MLNLLSQERLESWVRGRWGSLQSRRARRGQSLLGRVESSLQLLGAPFQPFWKGAMVARAFHSVCVRRLLCSCRHMCGWVKLAWCLASQNHVIKIWHIFLRCKFNLKNKIGKRGHIFTRRHRWLQNVREQWLLRAHEMMRNSLGGGRVPHANWFSNLSVGETTVAPIT